MSLKVCFENETIQRLMEFLEFSKKEQRHVLKYFMQQYNDVADIIQAIMGYYQVFYEFDEKGICGFMMAFEESLA